jgi:hypothetical protein
MFVLPPLTHRLAVPPLPQGGEGTEILSFGVLSIMAGGRAALAIRRVCEFGQPWS